MSAENAKKFFDDVDKNDKLRAEVRKNFSNLAEIAKKHGYTFKRSDMLEHLRTRWGAGKMPKSVGDDPDTCCSSF